MIQVKNFTADKDDIVNKVLEQLPEGSFRDLKLLGEFKAFSKNHYMLIFEHPTRIEIKVPASSTTDRNNDGYEVTFGNRTNYGL